MNKVSVIAITAVAVMVGIVVMLLALKLVEDDTEPTRNETTSEPTTPQVVDEDRYDSEALSIVPGTTRAARLEMGYEACTTIDVYRGDFDSLIWDLAEEAATRGMTESDVEDLSEILVISTRYLCPEWVDELERWAASN